MQGLRADVRKTVFLKQPKTFREAEEMARLACSVETTVNSSPVSHMASQLGNLSQAVKSLITSGGIISAQSSQTEEKKLMDVIQQNNAVLAQLSSSMDKLRNPETSSLPLNVSANTVRLNTQPNLAAFSDSPAASGTVSGLRSEIQQLKEMTQNLGRETDARIRGLARRNQSSRNEQPRERTRDGRPVCYTCGRTGHLQTSCPERRNYGPQPQPSQQQQYWPSYSPNSNNNQPQEIYRNHQDPSLAILDEGLHNDEIMGTIQPSSSDGPFYARRSKPPPTKLRHTVQWECSQANLHEQDAEQQVLASLSNQKPEIAQYSVPEVKPPRGQVPHKPDHAGDLSSVPEEVKPIVDVVLRVIKHKTVTIPTANNAKKSADKDSRTHTYPGHPTATQVSQESLNKSVSVSHEVQSGRNSSSENYTLAASKQVQLLVDTGACVSAIDEQFVHKTYGQFLPKMTNGSLTSVQTISGDKVPVLGKISVLLKLNGFEYSCGFHVMKNLAYDAILGRDFLQRHQARIDLETNSLTFKGSTDVRKKRKSTGVSELPVMGTYHSAIRPM